eukprot:TRINITY_DN705_c0_g1_i13.p3 TRINITY_DN705_c0_g1~~TRINITY_DN705_c0_g1_i13.p3  ORF type:complete len:208 (-),score=19.06 TRINITY_DN705_c0_g1_i13:731-1354(-)
MQALVYLQKYNNESDIRGQLSRHGYRTWDLFVGRNNRFALAIVSTTSSPPLPTQIPARLLDTPVLKDINPEVFIMVEGLYEMHREADAATHYLNAYAGTSFLPVKQIASYKVYIYGGSKYDLQMLKSRPVPGIQYDELEVGDAIFKLSEGIPAPIIRPDLNGVPFLGPFGGPIREPINTGGPFGGPWWTDEYWWTCWRTIWWPWWTC